MSSNKLLRFLMICLTFILVIPFAFSVQLKWYDPHGNNFYIKVCLDSRVKNGSGVMDVNCTEGKYSCLIEGGYWIEFDFSEEGNYTKDCRAYQDPYKCDISPSETNYGKLWVNAWSVSWDNNQQDCECYGKRWMSYSRFESGTNGQCCEDDSGEYYLTRVCGGGVCSSDINDNMCCNQKSDCVYNSACYPDNSGLGLNDGSTDMEFCINNTWADPDNSREICEKANGTRATKWVTAGVCGKRETGTADCNDVVSMTQDFCCGDDENEVMKPGFDNVCFVKDNDCYSYADEKYYLEGEYTNDKICEKGVVTSRIKLVSLQLMDIAGRISPDNYALYCDKYEKALNYYWYQLWGVSVNLYLNEVNNVCVLKLPESVIFGATLNQPINDVEYPFTDTLTGISNCDNAANNHDGNFHQCSSGDSRAWYNSKIEGVVYSKNNLISLPSDFELNFWDAFLTFLKNPFQTIFNSLFDIFNKEGQLGDYGFINSTKEFSKIYINKNGGKSIKGITENVMEPASGEYISVTYTGYDSDICGALNKTYEDFKQKGKIQRKDLAVCYYDSAANSYYVAANFSAGIALWPELTAKLRP